MRPASRISGRAIRQGRLCRVLPKAPAEFGAKLCFAKRCSRTPLLAYGAACPRSGQTGAPRQACASIPEPARPEPTGQGARPTGSGAVSRLWPARAGCCVDQMGEIGAVIPVDRTVAVRSFGVYRFCAHGLRACFSSRRKQIVCLL
jgi:hypothetical protein